MILQACPTCQRQYDITTVPVGTRLRCACDALMTVRVPAEVIVRARKCGNCGGAIEPGDLACSYCASKLVQLDLEATLCPQCFKRVEGDAKHCQGCGTRIQAQALTPMADGVVCPRCAGDLRARSLGELCVVECLGCEGLWVSAQVFDVLCRTAPKHPVQQLVGAAGRDLDAGSEPELVRYIPCLTCSQLMLRRNFRFGSKLSHVIVDFCRDHGVWLDRMELERLMSFLRERIGAEGEAGLGFSDALAPVRRPRPEAQRPSRPARHARPGNAPRGGGLLDDCTLVSVLAWILGELF